MVSALDRRRLDMEIRLPPNPPASNSFVLLLISFLILSLCIPQSDSTPTSDAGVLLRFKATLSLAGGINGGNSPLSSWVDGSVPCAGDEPKWTGVLCSGGSVLGLQMEGMGLSGTLAGVSVLAGIPTLRTISLWNNALSGEVPDLAGALRGIPLRSIYLSGNNLTGAVPDAAFDGMVSMRKVVLSSNSLSGAVPSSLAGLPKLVELRLDHNRFEGRIPDMDQAAALAVVDFSDNNLAGPIPAALSKLDPSAFAGNKGLCGPPLATKCDAVTTAAAAAGGAKKRSTSKTVMLIAIAAAILLVLAVIAAFIAARRCRSPRIAAIAGDQKPAAGAAAAPAKWNNPAEFYKSSSSASAATDRDLSSSAAARSGGGLVFVREVREKFDLQDLLKASAEVLGGGSLSSSYRAVLAGATAPAMVVVVKRFKEMNAVGKDQFTEHMRRLGRLSHPNLLPLLAYYYRKEEKLLVTDFAVNGSLANALHFKATSPPLNWQSRLRIVKGVARGLKYLYDELAGILTLPHGHLKSSNVLLIAPTSPEGGKMEAVLTDYGLAAATNPAMAARAMAAYRSPEYAKHGVVSKQSDVWCLGILILELLTGKNPASHHPYRGGASAGDLASWVNSVVREEWTGEVFDGRMEGTRSCEGDMLQLLQIGIGCSERSSERRMDMAEALRKIEEIRERDTGEGEENYSSFMSDGDNFQSVSMAAAEEFSFSTKK